MPAISINIPPLETERLILRTPGSADTSAMVDFLRSERGRFYGGPMSDYDAWHKFSAYVGQWVLRGYGMFSVVLKDTDETIGMAGPFQPINFVEPEISWLLTSERFEGHGYATEACRTVLAYLHTTLGWKNVVSYIDTANAASRVLAQRLGAQLETDPPCPVANCQSYRHDFQDVLR